jgi:hypothetical protein
MMEAAIVVRNRLVCEELLSFYHTPALRMKLMHATICQHSTLKSSQAGTQAIRYTIPLVAAAAETVFLNFQGARESIPWN